METKSKVINFLFYATIFAIMYFVMRPFYVDFTLYGDSLAWNWYLDDNFWNPFLQNEHGWIFYSAIFCVNNRVLPVLFDIHPQMYYKHFYSLIVFSYYLVFFLAMKNNFVKYFMPKYGVLWTLAIFPIILQAFRNSGFMWALQHDAYSLGYVFLPLFFIIFSGTLEKIYVKNLFAYTTKKTWLILSGLLIIILFSYEMPRFILCLSPIIGYFLHKFFLPENSNKQTNKPVKKICFITYLSFVLLNIMLIFAPNYTTWFGERNNHLSVQSLIADLPNMIPAYFQTLFVENRIYLFVLTIMLFLLKFLVQNKEEKRKLFVWTVSILISIFAFSLAIVIGSEIYEYYFMHPGIRFLTKAYLLYLIFSLSGYLISVSENLKKKFMVIILCFIPLLLNVQKESLDLSYYHEEIYKSRYRAYILERFFILCEKPKKIYYHIKDSVFFEKNSLNYYLYFYDRNYQQSDYVHKTLCSPQDDFETCNKIISDILKKEHNFEFSKEELEKLDFNIYKKYYDF